eukprot:461251-Amphidinium_carterae.1
MFVLALGTVQGTALDEVGDKGEFKRKESTYRHMIEKGGRFEPEKDTNSRPNRVPFTACSRFDFWIKPIGILGCFGHESGSI